MVRIGAEQRLQALAARALAAWRKWRGKESRGPVLYTASSMWLSIAQMVSGIAMVRYVVPAEMGLWSSVNLALTYSFIVLAGVQNGLNRELPFYLGANDEGMARRLAQTGLLYTLGGCVLALVSGLGVVAFLIYQNHDAKLITAVAAVTLLIAFQFFQNYLIILFRSKGSFADLARIQAWSAILMLVTTPILLAGYNGMVLRSVIIAGIPIYWMYRIRPMRVRPSWTTDAFWKLVKTGLPIFGTDYLMNSTRTLDKVALLQFGGVEQVGLYALATSAFAAFAGIPKSVAHYVYPRMSHHYGRTNNPRVLWGLAWKTTVIVLGVMIPIAVVAALLLPFGVKFLFPKYIDATRATQIVLFAAVAYGANISANALASLKAWSHLIAYRLICCALFAALPFAAVRVFNSPLDGVAYAMLAANLLGAVLALIATYIATRKKSGPAPVAVQPRGEPSVEKGAVFNAAEVAK